MKGRRGGKIRTPARFVVLDDTRTIADAFCSGRLTVFVTDAVKKNQKKALPLLWRSTRTHGRPLVDSKCTDHRSVPAVNYRYCFSVTCSWTTAKSGTGNGGAPTKKAWRSDGHGASVCYCRQTILRLSKNRRAYRRREYRSEPDSGRVRAATGAEGSTTPPFSTATSVTARVAHVGNSAGPPLGTTSPTDNVPRLR